MPAKMVTQNAVQLADVQGLLDAFLVENPELEQLNARLSEFNLFDILQVSQMEIRHSNVLAWLLTPIETHGLGDLFLRRFISQLLLEHDIPDVTLTAARIELEPLGEIEVYREWHNIDVLVVSRSQRWCVLIENKVRAKESKGQLERYITEVEAEYAGYQIIPVYLTLEGDEPSIERFVALDYGSVLALAERLTQQNMSRIPEDAQIFLRHYLEVLRRLTMQDEQLANLCKTIYRKHRNAIDLIVEYGGSSQVVGICEPVLNQIIDCAEMKLKTKQIWFVPEAIAQTMPSVDLVAWKDLPGSFPLWCWMEFRKKKADIRLVLEVGPIGDFTLRNLLLKEIESAEFKFSKQAFGENKKYTRIVSVKQNLPRDEDGEIRSDEQGIEKSFRDLWGKFWPQAEKIIPVLRDFDWTL